MARVPTLKTGVLRLDPLDPVFATSAGLDRRSFGGATADAALSKAESIKQVARSKLREGELLEQAGQAKASGAEALGKGVLDLGTAGVKIALERQIQDNERMAGQAKLELDQELDKISVEYGKLQGQHALDAKDETTQKILDARAEVISKYGTSPQLKQIVAQNAGVKTQSQLFELERTHELNRKKANYNTSIALIGSTTAEAARNPSTIEAAHKTIKVEVGKMADSEGWVGKLKNIHVFELNKHFNTLHTAMIDGFVSRREYAKGVAYLNNVLAMEKESGTAEFTAAGRASARTKLNQVINQKVSDLTRLTSSLKKALDFGINPVSAVTKQVAELKDLSIISPAAKRQLDSLQESVTDYTKMKAFGEATTAAQAQVIERWHQHQDIPVEDARRLIKYEKTFAKSGDKWVRHLRDDAAQAVIAIRASGGNIKNLPDHFGALHTALKVMAKADNTTAQILLKDLDRELKDAGIFQASMAIQGKSAALAKEQKATGGVLIGAAARTLPERQAAAKAEDAAIHKAEVDQLSLMSANTEDIIKIYKSGKEPGDEGSRAVNQLNELRKLAEKGHVSAVKQIRSIMKAVRISDIADRLNIGPLAQRILNRLELRNKVDRTVEETEALKIGKQEFDKEVKEGMRLLKKEVDGTVKILSGSPDGIISPTVPKHLDRVRATVKRMIAMEVDGAQILAEQLDEAERNFILGNDTDYLTLDKQGNIIRNIHAQGTLTPEEHRQLQRRMESRQRLIKGIQEGNGLQIAEEKKIIPTLPEFAPNDPAYWSVIDGAAQKVEDVWGVPIMGATKSQLEVIVPTIMGQDIDGEPTDMDDQLRMLNAMKAGLSETRLNHIAQETYEKHPEFAVVLSTSNDDVNREILRGKRIRMTPGNKISISTEKQNNIFSEVLGNTLMAEGSKPYIPFQQAALDVYIARRQGAGDDEKFDKNTYKDAIEYVTGGILARNGQKFIAPTHGFTSGQWQAMWTGLTQEQFIQYGNGHPVYAGPASPSDVATDTLQPAKLAAIRSRAQFVSVGPGRYYIQLIGQKDKFLHTAEGGVFILNIKQLIDDGNHAPYTSWIDDTQKFLQDRVGID